MRRRQAIGLIGAAALAAPFCARAQQPARLRRVAVLVGGAQGDPVQQDRVAAFRQGLRDLRWIEGETIALDIRYGGGDAARIAALAAELAALSPDVIVVTV